MTVCDGDGVSSTFLAVMQPRSQGLSSLPHLVVGSETLAATGHVTTQNLGGRKICWKGWVFYRPLDQMYLSTHPPCGFEWIDGHVTSGNQVSVPTTKGGGEERPWERGCITARKVDETPSPSHTVTHLNTLKLIFYSPHHRIKKTSTPQHRKSPCPPQIGMSRYECSSNF